VGRVAALREHLRWFDVRPLFGRRVVVTRPREQAHELVELFEDQGAHVILSPTVRLAPATDYAPIDEACADIASFDWVVLPALTGVEVFLRRLLAGPNDIRSLKGVGLCVMGQSSVERFEDVGVRPDVAIGEFRPELVVEALAAKGSLQGRRILIPHAEGAREHLTAELRQAGAEVVEVGAYRIERVLPGDPGEPDLYKMLLEKQIDVVTFASPSTVKEFVDIHGADAVADILRTTAVACVGPVTAQTAQALGITPAIVPAEYSMAAMVAAVVKHFRTTSS